MNSLLIHQSPLLFVGVSVAFGVMHLVVSQYKSAYVRHVLTIYVITIAMLLFAYRVPLRTNAYPENYMICPSDGKIMSIYKINDITSHVAIYLNMLDAHVQWCPVDGTVISSTHRKGTFHPAYMLHKSRYNERVETIIYNPYIDDEIKVVQIAGQFARRIANFVHPHDEFERGDLFGMIKFGSRVDVFFPHDKIELLVHVGDRVLGNKTIFGKLL
jgi:phosphatidylserine decarboxylase